MSHSRGLCLPTEQQLMMRDLDDGSAGAPRPSIDTSAGGAGPTSFGGPPFSAGALGSTNPIGADSLRPSAPSLSQSLGVAPSELQNQMSRDMDRLRRISAHISSTRSWADQYADEASALSALAKGAALAHASPLLGSIDRQTGWRSDALGPPTAAAMT